MSPTMFSEAGNSFVGLDQRVYTASGNAFPEDSGNARNQRSYSDAYFSDLSLWDTFRTTLPWQLLTREDVSIGILRSLASMTTAQNGVFPRWPLGSVETGCMIGFHGAAFVLEALLKSNGSWGSYFDVDVIQLALKKQTMYVVDPANFVNTSMADLLARSDVPHYLNYGFVSNEAYPLYERDGKPASLTLTYAFDDYVLGGISKFVGDTLTAEEATGRGQNYKNIWSYEREIMCPRSGAGDTLLQCPDDPKSAEAYGSLLLYLFSYRCITLIICTTQECLQKEMHISGLGLFLTILKDFSLSFLLQPRFEIVWNHFSRSTSIPVNITKVYYLTLITGLEMK